MKPTKEQFGKFNANRFERLQMVRQFHTAMGLSVNCSCPSLEAEMKLREKIIGEEWGEMEAEAHKFLEGNGDIAALAKELADVEYVLLGTFVSLGDAVAVYHAEDVDILSELRKALVSALFDNTKLIGRELIGDFDRIFAEVHRSNMSKLGDDGRPVFREDGKVLKGKNYSPADLSFLNSQKIPANGQ